MKKTISCILIALTLCTISFYAGFYVSSKNSKAARHAQVLMAKKIYKDIKHNYGAVKAGTPEYENIIGTITLTKDINLAIFLDNETKTIKVYE